MAGVHVVADGQPLRRLSRITALRLRAAWRAFLLVTLGLFAASVPARHDQLRVAATGFQEEVARLFGDGGPINLISSPSVYPFIVLALEIALVGLLG
ncbi:MAG: hypothetical protein ACRDK3_14670 [Actinomycetota bacterium]